MITYRLLHDLSGVITERTPIMVTGGLTARFEGAPQGAVAIFSGNGTELYRPLNEDGECTIAFTPSTPNMLGERVSVTVALLDGTVSAPRWRCEGLLLHWLSGGKAMIIPDDGHLSETVAALRVEADRLAKENKELTGRLMALEEKYEKLMSGYNIV